MLIVARTVTLYVTAIAGETGTLYEGCHSGAYLFRLQYLQVLRTRHTPAAAATRRTGRRSILRKN
jgi:hypothetical protein